MTFSQVDINILYLILVNLALTSLAAYLAYRVLNEVKSLKVRKK